MSRALFYFFRLPFSRALDTHLTTTTLHLILYTFLNRLSRLLFLPFRLPFKVVGGFGSGLPPTHIYFTLILYHTYLFLSSVLFSSSVCRFRGCLNYYLLHKYYITNKLICQAIKTSASVCPWA